MRDDGEDDILAPLALVSPRRAKRNTLRAAMVVVGLVGATLLHGDGCIASAISVLSAVEGLNISQLKHAVLPLTVAILLGPFLIQRRSTGFMPQDRQTAPRSRLAGQRPPRSTTHRKVWRRARRFWLDRCWRLSHQGSTDERSQSRPTRCPDAEGGAFRGGRERSRRRRSASAAGAKRFDQRATYALCGEAGAAWAE
jgi:hypothetical protein